MPGPLEGLTVLDMTRVMAGPWSTQIFADLGATVIKIERPGIGDETRHWGPPWLKDENGEVTPFSGYFLSANRGKHSVTLDFTKPEGKEILLDLARSADILMENFKTGDLARKGLGYEDIKAINPGIVYCSITGFGQTGPMREDAGYDYLIQGQGGLMSITGVPDGQPGEGPQRVGIAVSDLTTGMNAVIAILAALHHRAKTGTGQHIDMALLDVQVSWLANQALNFFCSGSAPTRTGEYHPNLAPYQPFATADGRVIIAVGNDGQFARMCDVLGLAHLTEDPRFATNPARVTNRPALIEILTGATTQMESKTILEALRAVKVPCGVIQTIDQVFEDEQVIARKMQINLDHPKIGKIPGVANPIKFSETQQTYTKAPPLLGEDTDSILQSELGLTPEQVAGLRDKGII